jgi:hypothetical protein
VHSLLSPAKISLLCIAVLAIAIYFIDQENCVALQEDEQEVEGDGDRAGEDRVHDRGNGGQAHGLHGGAQQVARQ